MSSQQGSVHEVPAFTEIVRQTGIRDIFTLTYCASKMKKSANGYQYETGDGSMVRD